MPLHEIGEYHAWVERESPSAAAQRVARAFLAEIGDVPWDAPSVPIAELSNQPIYEMRTAALKVPGEREVEVWYLHDYATDLLGQPRDGVQRVGGEIDGWADPSWPPPLAGGRRSLPASTSPPAPRRHGGDASRRSSRCCSS